MNLLVPAALAFGAIIPIILLLYFMRPKRQERVVGSTLLWQQAMQDLQASRPWQRLRITPLLLIQLLAATVIVLILARPAIFSSNPVSGDTIVILQASASMQATDVPPSRFESARNTIRDFIGGLGSSDRLSLITMAHTPQVLIAESQDKVQLNAALQRARVTNQDADLEQAISLAASLAAGRSNIQVLVIGDGHTITPDQPLVVPFPVRYLSVGTDAPNVALMALASRTIQGKLIAFAQVANYSHQSRSIPVELYADSKLVTVQTITLAAGTNGSLQWGPLAPGSRFLHARIESQDAMSIDHEAWSIVGGAQHARALLVTKGNGYVEKFLSLQPNIDLFETTPDKYVHVNTYDLTVFDGLVPPTLPSGSLFFINPPAGSYIFGKVGPEIKVSQINAGNDTLNLLANVDLSSIHTLQGSHDLQPASWSQPIITTPQTPLFITGENNNQRIAVLGFDIHNSDFPLQPAFPLLMHNLVNWFLPPPVSGNGQVMPGAPVTIQAWPGATQVSITGPDQQVTNIGPPITPYAKTDQVGIYQVSQQVRGQNLQGAFTVNLFNANQSKLAPARALPILHSTNFTAGGNIVSYQLREVWPWVAAFLLLVLCFEWWLFSRSYRQKAAQGATGRDGRKLTGQKQSATDTINRSLRRYPVVARVQDELIERYRLASKRFAKVSKRTRNKLARPTAKGDKRVNF
ncbi:MAG TPA: BatA and WFA domain-containing protein [Ktedonosporobacter sp.]|nr:BatA and WFA domain-containing protein [Ktedonosporobacter sp.]